MSSPADKRLMKQLPNLSGLSHEEKDAIIHLLFDAVLALRQEAAPLLNSYEAIIARTDLLFEKAQDPIRPASRESSVQ
jgi:hypothetical protein